MKIGYPVKILHLTLKRKYFDLIACGNKRVEFREAKPYWVKRLDGKNYDIVRFRNGYRPESPTMDLEILNIRLENGWYHISLGKIISAK